MSSNRHLRSGTGLSWFALILGVGLGITAGLIYTWQIDPVVERNTAPWQLSSAGQEDYVVAVALSYAYNHDLPQAFNRLRALRPNQNVWDLVATVACDRVKTGKTVTNSDIRVIRALEQLYRPQGASGCADGLYPTPVPLAFATPIPTSTPTSTLPPPLTKTPTPPLPTSTPFQAAVPTTTPPSGSFVLARLESFCDPTVPGVIEVRVYDRQGQGVPGVPVQVTWSGDQRDTFFTGLKPEREMGYADFEMTPGRSYSVSIPGLTSRTPVVNAEPCQATVDGETVSTTTSYWINFQQQTG
ncbi:MAG TPA: hypothetical protein VMT24_09585 [Aggregatilineaceae bacterium]|nr:hypothetical protein [Aggregatilineaceae bacterium]